MAAAVPLFFVSAGTTTFAGSAQWNLNPGSGDWNTAANWTPSVVPNGASDTATFDTSSVTTVSLSANVAVDGVVFDSSANAYTIQADGGSLLFDGAGVTNNSGVLQNFTTTTNIEFENSATAGNMTVYTNSGAGSYTLFTGNSSGGNASLVNANATAFIDISGLTMGGTTAGSIAGNGALFLGANNLTVGSDNTNTTFSGVIQDGGFSGGTEGSLTKVGTGTLTLSGANTYTGQTIANGGVLNVTGSITSAEALFVGYLAGTGALSATSGGTVSNTDGSIGQSATGTVTIDGAGSIWTNNGSLDVGESGGTGTLNITNGGKVSVSNAGANIGDSGTGMVMVDGVGSTWTNNGDLQVGNGPGAMGTLGISNGGVVSNNNANIGNGDNTTSAVVTVDGNGSTWTNNGDLYVGNGGSGSLTITNGGMVSNNNGFIGEGSTGTVTVDGAGSTWTNSGALTVSDGGTGKLIITNSGVVSASTTTIGNNGTVIDDASLMSPKGVSVMSGGLLKGTGTVTGNVVNDGRVSPGDVSLGTLHLIGNYQQNSDGTLTITIGSLTYFDNLSITGTATLDGVLDVLLAGYTGHAGDVFEIVTSSSLTGNFSTINLPSLSNGLYFTESTDQNNVYLTVVPEPSTWVAAFLTAGTLLGTFLRQHVRRAAGNS